MGEWSYVLSISLIFSTTFRWWASFTAFLIYSFYTLVMRLGSTTEVVWMWRESKNFCLYWVFAWYSAQSIVPIQTELFVVQICAFLNSWHFKVCWYSRSMWNFFQLQLLVRHIYFIALSTCAHTFQNVCQGVL